MNSTELLAAIQELLAALDRVQDWEGTRVGDAMEAVERAVEAGG
jgi:hypothetical protein